MANKNFLRFLEQKSLTRKLQEAEFYNDLETFFPSQSKEEEEVVALILYGLVEQCDNTKPQKCRTGTEPTKNHFEPPDIWNGPMKNSTVPILSLF